MNTCSLSFFDAAYENFCEATSNTGEIKRTFRLAGFTFCLKFAGMAMVDTLTCALKHLEVEAQDDCDLTICLWDSISSNSPNVEFPWTGNAYALRGEVLGYDSDRIYTVLDIHTKVLNVFDKERNLALYWINDAKRLPWWINGSPLQLILHWWMRTRGYQLTHAAVVGHSHGGVLLAGKGGSGKSTTSLACMKAGMKYVSEDYCLLSDQPEIWAFSVYNSAKIEEKTLQWFPDLGKHITNLDRSKDEKAFLFHHKFQPEIILSKCPLKAILTLKIENSSECWLEPTDAHSTLTSLSVTTIWQLTHTGLPVFNHLKRITEKLPCYQLHLGSNFMQAPKLIEKLL